MAEQSTIEWTDATWNPVTGCSVVSPGCTNCYAMQLAGTRLKHHPSRAGLTRESGGRPKWTGEVRLNEQWLTQPLRWASPKRIFVCAHGDLFHESVPDEWIDRVFAVMALAPQHTFQVLTKRAERMRAYCSDLEGHDARWFSALQMVRTAEGSFALADAHDRLDDHPPLRNVWLGVSVEDQARADERIPDLLATPAAVRFLSCEPLLGPVDLQEAMARSLHALPDLESMQVCTGDPMLHWVIAGGESGVGARPMHPDWARSLRDQCEAAGVPFFFKQWGMFSPLAKARPVEESRGLQVAWPDGSIGDGVASERGGAGTQLYRATKSVAGRLLDGETHDGFPAPSASPRLRVSQSPSRERADG